MTSELSGNKRPTTTPTLSPLTHHHQQTTTNTIITTAIVSSSRHIKVDQLDPSLVQHVNTNVSAVVERYLLDDQGIRPKTTRKAYGIQQAEWMIASRAPKRGKRRKAETQRLKAERKRKPKKQKREGSPMSSSTTRVEAVDVIVVGRRPAKDQDQDGKLELELELELESKSDQDDFGPDSASGTSSMLKQ
ncbi:hypothetical protein N657DRAFT_675866, partial [Parathielavia appendiculata]